jgi:WXG100 family type VII secretion target
MANADKIQADYDQLGQIAAQFTQQGDRTLALGRQVYNCMSQLRDGGWIGVGANRFYNEMESLVLPGLERLVNALHTGGAQTARIAQILRAAEEQAGQLFYGGDGEFSTMPVPNSGGSVDFSGVVGSAGSSSASSGGVNMGGMIGAMVGGMLGGPLGALVGGALGNAIGSGPFGLSGRLTALDVGKSSALSPVKLKDLNYIGDPKKLFERSGGHEFSKQRFVSEGPLKNVLDQTKVRLLGGDLWTQRAALMRGDLDFQAGALKGGTYAELLSYDASAKWDVSVGNDGVKIGASTQMGAYLTRVGASAEIGGLKAAAEAYVGAQVQGELGAVLMPGQAYVRIGGDAFIGGRAQGQISYQHQVVDGLTVGGTASGYVSYGLGVQGDVKFGYDQGKIHIGGALGATLGVGVGGKFDVTIDAQGIINQGVQTAQEVGRNIAEFGRGVFDIGRMFLP